MVFCSCNLLNKEKIEATPAASTVDFKIPSWKRWIEASIAGRKMAKNHLFILCVRQNETSQFSVWRSIIRFRMADAVKIKK